MGKLVCDKKLNMFYIVGCVVILLVVLNLHFTIQQVMVVALPILGLRILLSLSSSIKKCGAWKKMCKFSSYMMYSIVVFEIIAISTGKEPFNMMVAYQMIGMCVFGRVQNFNV